MSQHSNQQSWGRLHNVCSKGVMAKLLTFMAIYWPTWVWTWLLGSVFLHFLRCFYTDFDPLWTLYGHQKSREQYFPKPESPQVFGRWELQQGELIPYACTAKTGFLFLFCCCWTKKVSPAPPNASTWPACSGDLRSLSVLYSPKYMTLSKKS